MAAEPAEAGTSARQLAAAPCQQLKPSARGIRQAAHASAVAASAVVIVGTSPPSISTRFFVRPGQSVRHPEYMRDATNLRPSRRTLRPPARLITLANATSSQIALRIAQCPPAAS